MSGDWMRDPEMQAWGRRAIEELVPMIKDTAATVSIVPSRLIDVKYAVELGFTIMLDKPLILVVRPGVSVPPKLVAVADEIVEIDADPYSEESRRAMIGALDRIVKRRKEARE